MKRQIRMFAKGSKMMSVTIDLPPDVEQILRSQAEKASVDPEEYLRFQLDWYLYLIANNLRPPATRSFFGWDWVLAFAQYVRENVDTLALDFTIGKASRPTATPHERAEAFRAWARLPRPKTPLLSDEALSRESIYEDIL